MDVKFEEEPYEDEDWFLMVISELIFDKLKLEKPEIDIDFVPLVEEEEKGEVISCNLDEDVSPSTKQEEPDLK